MIPNGQLFLWMRCQCLKMHWQCFEMILNWICNANSVPLKNIASVSKRNGNALQCIFKALQMHCNRKTLQHYFFFFLITLPGLTILWRRGERNQSAVYINSIVSEKRITGLPSWSYLNKRRHWCVEFYKILSSLRFEHNFRCFSCL